MKKAPSIMESVGKTFTSLRLIFDSVVGIITSLFTIVSHLIEIISLYVDTFKKNTSGLHEITMLNIQVRKLEGEVACAKRFKKIQPYLEDESHKETIKKIRSTSLKVATISLLALFCIKLARIITKKR